MAEKITNINVEGRVYEFLSGQGVKGACTAPASSWTKPIVLPEGAVLLDGLIMAITFVNGNSVGFSGTKTIYSSDGENFYYDQAKTDPVTFPPVDNYTLEHTSGEEYSFSAFPTIVYGDHTLPVRDAKGHITGGAVWNTGDTVICIFIDNMFLMLSAAVSNAVASGDMNPVTSNAVAGALNPLHIAKGGSIYADGTKADVPIIKMKDNTADAYGNGIVIGGGGITIIGGGESADTYYSGSGLSAGSESMVVANDGAIIFASNLQSNYASRKEMTMGADGKLSNPQGFVGNLTGNCSGNSATATTARNARNCIAWCTTASATSAKTATLEGYALTSGDRIPLYITTTNTSATALTLNVNSTGAKTIRINGSLVTSATRYQLPAGLYMAHYDGTYWNLYNLINMSGGTSFNGSASAITLNASYGAIGVKAWYMSTTASYIVFTNGLKIQWFTLTENAQNYTFAIPFTNTNYVLSADTGVIPGIVRRTVNKSTTGFTYTWDVREWKLLGMIAIGY